MTLRRDVIESARNSARSLSAGLRGALDSTTISRKRIEVYQPDEDTTYHATVEEAQSLTQSNQAIWDGPRRIIKVKDTHSKVTWAPKQSGYGGPLVLQVVG